MYDPWSNSYFKLLNKVFEDSDSWPSIFSIVFFRLWRLAVLVIAILSSMVCDVMNVAAVGTERTVMSSSIRSRGSNDLATSLGPGAVKAWSNLAKTRLTCSSRLSQNEISSFGVLNTRGSHSRRRGSRKLKILQARLQREEGISRSGR